MKGEDEIFRFLSMNRKARLRNQLIKGSFMLVLAILNLIMIYAEALKGSILVTTILIFGEILFIGIIFMLVIPLRNLIEIENSKIVKCIKEPEIVIKIVVSYEKLIIHLEGQEEVTLFIKHSISRAKLLANIEEVFGEEKIIRNY